MLIKYVYIVFLGLILATFVGVGISAFYKGPVYPETPLSLKYSRPYQEVDNATPSAEYIKEQEAFDAQSKLFQDQTNQYNKNVSIMAMIFAVLMLIVSLTLFKRITIIADGLLLGGVLTLAYSIIRGFGSEDDMFRFFVVGAGLITAMVLGYIKFVAPQAKKTKSSK
jgi:hypothetical protein